MTEVMKKLQETPSETDGGSAPKATSAPPETASSGFVPDGAEQGAAAGEVPSITDAAAARSFEVDNRTVKWDAKRVHPAVIAFHDRCSSVCEQYRTVRARLLALEETGLHRVIAITSAVPQEGKSVTAVNLGMVMAEDGEHRILIADADFRRMSIAKMVGAKESPGLVNVLRGELELKDALLPTPFSNLKIIPAGSQVDKNYAELLGGSMARSVLRQMHEVFDYTFVDTPPITTVADVGLIVPHCDGALVVIEMRRTPEPAVQQGIRSLQTSNVKILGCILSRFRDHRTQYYGRYYNYY